MGLGLNADSRQKARKENRTVVDPEGVTQHPAIAPVGQVAGESTANRKRDYSLFGRRDNLGNGVRGN
jgi:hypothetical protein